MKYIGKDFLKKQFIPLGDPIQSWIRKEGEKRVRISKYKRKTNRPYVKSGRFARSNGKI